jgi:hypothetical protein
LLALDTTEQPPLCCRRVIQTPPSSNSKTARIFFLFVLRLHTGIDLRDKADLALARLVTIGSWFSDCIGASSLTLRSRIVRVNNHQIEVISTHRKVGHSPSIMVCLIFFLTTQGCYLCPEDNPAPSRLRHCLLASKENKYLLKIEKGSCRSQNFLN